MPDKSKKFLIKPSRELGCEPERVICHLVKGLSVQDQGEKSPRRNRRNHSVIVTSARMLRAEALKREGHRNARQRPEELD